ncbi:hypothetical protein WJX82_003456 [Trebouxia sp. C0006]
MSAKVYSLGTAVSAANMSNVASSWTSLQNDPKAVDSLHTLATNRHALSSISTTQVATLLQVLEQLWRDQAIPAAQRTTAFSQTYHLLARWAHIQRSTARSSTDHSQLQESVSGALQLLQSHWCTAQLSAASILFLGAASQGLATDQREAAAKAACSAIQAHKAELSQSSYMTELAAGLANIMISLQCQGTATNSGHWQEGMTGVLAAGGLLEGLARDLAGL